MRSRIGCKGGEAMFDGGIYICGSDAVSSDQLLVTLELASKISQLTL